MSLGPTLFLIYVNSVVQDITSPYKLFADDIKIYLSFSPSESSSIVSCQQANIDKLIKTSAEWGLTMNVGKCVCMRFSRQNRLGTVPEYSPYSIGGERMKFVTSHRDLGVTIDSTLKFHLHIRSRVLFINNLTSNILSCTLCREANFILNIYKMHIRPLLEYCSYIWNTGYAGDLSMMERIQRRWTRSIEGFEGMSYGQRLSNLNLFSVQGRLLRADLILTYKIFHGLTSLRPDSLFQVAVSSRTRGHNYKILTPLTHIEVRRRFFAVRVINWWNSLGHDTVNADSLNNFKVLLHRDLGAALFEFHD